MQPLSSHLCTNSVAKGLGRYLCDQVLDKIKACSHTKMERHRAPTKWHYS